MSADSEPITSEDLQNLVTSCINMVSEMTDRLRTALNRIKAEGVPCDDHLYRLILLGEYNLGSVKRCYAGLSMWSHSYDTVTSDITPGPDMQLRLLSFINSMNCCKRMNESTLESCVRRIDLLKDYPTTPLDEGSKYGVFAVLTIIDSCSIPSLPCQT